MKKDTSSVDRAVLGWINKTKWTRSGHKTKGIQLMIRTKPRARLSPAQQNCIVGRLALERIGRDQIRSSTPEELEQKYKAFTQAVQEDRDRLVKKFALRDNFIIGLAKTIDSVCAETLTPGEVSYQLKFMALLLESGVLSLERYVKGVLRPKQAGKSGGGKQGFGKKVKRR